MNLGELKLQNFFFNSQLQLNNELLNSGKSASKFDEILKTKSIDRSEVSHENRYKGFTNATMDKEMRVQLKSKRSDFSPPKDVDELKVSIKEGIAQKKFEKETGVTEIDKSNPKDLNLQTLKEKIQTLKEAIKAEVLKPEDAEALEQIAAMMGIEVEALIEQLTQMSGSEQNLVIDKIVDFLQLDLIEPEKLVQELTQLAEVLPKEQLEAFEAVLNQMIEKLPENELKETLVELEQVVETLKVSALEVEAPIIQETLVVEPETKVKEENAQNKAAEMNLPKTEGEMQVKVVEVKTDQAKQDGQQQPQQQQEEKPILSLETKTVSKTVGTNSVEEQVNVMKYDASVISSTKEQPKMVLARSVMNQVIQGTKMSINMSDQGSEILIKLNPKNLGNVALKMSFDKGTLMAQIQVENQTVKSIIQSNLADLKNALKQEGYIIGDLDVSVNKENTGQGEHPEQGTSQRYKKQIGLETFEEVEERIALQKNVVTDQTVDYLA